MLIMMMKQPFASHCRACKSQSLSQVHVFKRYPFFDDRVTLARKGSEVLADLPIYICNDCLLVQSINNIDFTEYYKDYVYSSGASPFAVRYMTCLVSTLRDILGEAFPRNVLDIGSGDGRLLKIFQEVGCEVLGFEGSLSLCKASEKAGVRAVNALFNHSSASKLDELGFLDIDLICLLHTFDHLPDPSLFLEDVKRVLSASGMLLLEVHSLDKMKDNCEGAIFGHEHTCYFSELSLRRVLSRSGFEIIDYNFVPPEIMRGASQIVLCKLADQSCAHQASLNPTEKRDALDLIRSIHEGSRRLREYAEDCLSDNRRLAGFGGWGRGITCIAQAELTERHLVCVLDNNEQLLNCFIPGTSIPIMVPTPSVLLGIDEIIVFNYAYIDEIRSQIHGLSEGRVAVTDVNDIRLGRKVI